MKKFAVKVEEGREGRDGKPSVGPVYRNLLAEDVFPSIDPHMSTAWQIFRTSFEKYPDNRMLGWRELVDGKWGSYKWKTYKEAYEETLLVGSALRAHGIEPGAHVGIYGANCPQWIVAMEACNSHRLICVPLYDTLGAGAVNYIIDHAELDIVFVQDKKVKQLLSPECTSAQRIKFIVCFSSLTEEQRDRAAAIGIKPYSWRFRIAKSLPFFNLFFHVFESCAFHIREKKSHLTFFHQSRPIHARLCIQVAPVEIRKV